MSDPILKPCPFCGGKARFFMDCDDYSEWYSAVCVECSAETDSFDTKEEAADAWNKRVGGAQ